MAGQRVTTVMISCVQRTQAREVTVPQLTAVGCEPRVFLSPCDPPSMGGTLAVALEALRAVKGAVLFTEDDIDVNADRFTRLLMQATKRNAVTYFYLNDTPSRLVRQLGEAWAARITGGHSIPLGLRRVNPAALFGTQCVFIPASVWGALLPFCESVHDGVQPFDGALLVFIQRRGLPVYVALPHPIQHRRVKDWTHGVPGAGEQQSMSFGLEIGGPA